MHMRLAALSVEIGITHDEMTRIMSYKRNKVIL